MGFVFVSSCEFLEYLLRVCQCFLGKCNAPIYKEKRKKMIQTHCSVGTQRNTNHLAFKRVSSDHKRNSAVQLLHIFGAESD